MKIAILDDYLNCANKFAPFADLGKDHQLKIYNGKLPDADLPAELRQYDVLLVMRERTAFTAGLLRQLPNLKLIVSTARRNDAIDLDACKAGNIMVCGTDSPGFATAELAFSLIMAAAKGLITEHNSMQHGGWQTCLAQDLRGSTLGVIGLGRLGGQLTVYAHALGMKVIAWSQNLIADHAVKSGVEPVSKADLMSRADYISIHLRLSDRTHHLVGASDLARMKQGAWIVNTSRAQIIDMVALVSALKSGKINAALDVFEIEPLPEDSELRLLPNLILSPHKGYVSNGTFEVFYKQSYQVLQAWLDHKPINILTGEV